MILLQDHELGAASQVVPIIETKRRDWWPGSIALFVMASLGIYIGVATNQSGGFVFGAVIGVLALALLRIDYRIYLNAETWTYHKRVVIWGLRIVRVNRHLSLYDKSGKCPVKFDRASRKQRGYRLGLIASDQSTIWIDFMGYQDQFQKARAACTGAWRSRIRTLDE